MDSPKDGCHHGDCCFAFNDSNFSDRILRIYIFSESTQSPSVKVKTLHVSSLILAGRSPFFYKLFSNGMKESAECYATLQINASEEAGLMELLKFMYSNNLTVTTFPAVLDVLMAANKFDVASCMRECGRLLRNLMITTPEYVLVYLDLPSTIIMDEALQPLTVFAKQFYSVHYKDITKFEDAILSLPLTDMEAIIASDYLQVTSEDAVYLFVLKWARAQYPKIIDRQRILSTRLGKFVRYPFMTDTKLMEVQRSKELYRSFAMPVVAEAFSFKRNTIRPDEINDNNSHRFMKRRAYQDWQDDNSHSFVNGGPTRIKP